MPQREFPAAPLVGVGGVVIDDLGRVLLIQRATPPGQGRWSLPGGLVELGEPLLDAVTREIAEESGLIVAPVALVEVVDRIFKAAETAPSPGEEARIQFHRIQFHYVVIDYWCRVLGGHLQPASDASAVAWAERREWIESNPYALEPIAIQVIEKGWQMAQAAKGA